MPRFPKRHESSWTCELLRLISAYLIPYLIHGLLFLHSLLFVHRLSQISTDYFLARKSTASSKTRLGSALIFIHGTSWLRLASQVHGLVCSAETSRVYTFSIALMQIKPLSIAQLAVPFSKPCPSVPKKFLIGFPSGRRTSFPNSRASSHTSQIILSNVRDFEPQRNRFSWKNITFAHIIITSITK